MPDAPDVPDVVLAAVVPEPVVDDPVPVDAVVDPVVDPAVEGCEPVVVVAAGVWAFAPQSPALTTYGLFPAACSTSRPPARK